MGACVRIIVLFLMVSAAVAVPAGNSKWIPKIDDEQGDLAAESSEIIPEAVVPPPNLQVRQAPDSVAAADQTDHSIEVVGDSQNFFPTFANFFEPRQQQNNFRLGFSSQEAAYSQRPNSYRSLLNFPLFNGYKGLEGFGKQNTPAASEQLVDASTSVLGSGNFGIIKGGTFFAQNDEESAEFGDGYNNYYNNGHGRPSLNVGYIANPRPNYNQDQFANFRDFADINAPANQAYSHYVVVYANKNATLDEVSEETRNVLSKPKNIIETLEQLETPSPPKKKSKAKSKLEATKQKMLRKKEQWKKSNSKYPSQKHDPEEPLLALS
ncbi:uncharacterized protein LOC112053606 [Bicyclus anynana]|uniref:Uncharacterized protein LOC112053606 n=1 Tax=Bicyclus anynana TaxID=110368 RepID=A0ABM3LPD1_BICAN|nr:uncharacterized protein LOC112053606 [Bicyclus anynana]